MFSCLFEKLYKCNVQWENIIGLALDNILYMYFISYIRNISGANNILSTYHIARLSVSYISRIVWAILGCHKLKISPVLLFWLIITEIEKWECWKMTHLLEAFSWYFQVRTFKCMCFWLIKIQYILMFLKTYISCLYSTKIGFCINTHVQ